MAFTMDDYIAARKLGERSYREALSRGDYPYLQVLEEILSHEALTSEVFLGTCDIPADSIKGTYTAGRRTAFAPNFMPLLPENTEFASKWTNLADAHLTEGIQVPVKAYEYMHSFYIMEGNKRVSVLKYFDSPSIAGNVTRILPIRDGSKKVNAYYEYLEFYRNCPVLFLVLDEPGAYREFCEFTGKPWGERWSDLEIENMRSLFFRFRKAYHSLRTEDMKKVTTGEALLVYLHFYPYEEAIGKMVGELKDDLEKIREEILLLTKKESVSMILEPEAAPKQGFFDRLFRDDRMYKQLNIAFIYLRPINASAWSYGHELGRQHLLNVFGDQLSTRVYEGIDEEHIAGVLEQAIAEGADLIFATSQLYMEYSMRAAAMHPEVKILNVGVNVAHTYIRTYYTRLYEAKFLSGVIAGSLAGGADIGFLADHPSCGTMANVNAFALGVQLVNPAAKVHVQWTGVRGSDPDLYFREHGITLLSGRDMQGTDEQNPRAFGLYRQTGEEVSNIALAVWNWGVLYQKLVTSVLNGSFDETEKAIDGRAVNYWWGFGADVIDLITGSAVPESTLRLVRHLENGIRNGSFQPFAGKIRAGDRVILSEDNVALSPKEIASIDWLNENIIGSIPALDDLIPSSRALVEIEREVEERRDI